MKFSKKYSIISICLLFSLFFNIKTTKASHAVGADLTYKCIDPINRIYEVKLSFYRDCYGINAPSSVRIYYESPSSGISQSIYLYQEPGTGNEVSPVCASANTTCSGGSNPGIEEYVYTGNITLPNNATDWKFHYRVGNRNAAINTISAPSSEYLYVEAELNNLTFPENNSPTFTNKPVPFICLGQNFCFNHGARDEDGDSLVYSLISPLSNQSVPVNYLFGYSAIAPLNTTSPMTFDSQSGSFCVTPAKIEITVMAVRVDEYRNGLKIGSVIRDMQVIVRSCSNELPNINGINGTGIYSDTICAFQPYCFDINTFDLDLSQDVTLTWNNGIQDATFSNGSGSRPIGEFCWTPDADDVQTLPHYFTVTVKDNNCTYNGIQTFAFQIFVQELVIDAGSDQTINCGDNANLSVNYSGSPSATYSWNNGMTGKNITVNNSGTYIVTVNDQGCSGQDTVIVNALNPPTINLSPNDSILCNNKKTITAVATPSGAIINWSTGETGNSILVDSPNWYYASVTMNGCSAIDSTLITEASFNWDINIAYSYGCSGDSTYFSSSKTKTSTGGTYNTIWSIEGNDYNKDSINYLFNTAGSRNINLQITSIEGCQYDTIFSIDVFDRPKAEFTLDSGCVNEQLLFTNTTNGNIAQHLWSYGDGTGSMNALIVNHSYNTQGVYPVKLIVQAQNGCIDSITQNILVNPIPPVDFSLNNVCLNDSLELKANLINSNNEYIWDDTQGAFIIGTDVKTIFNTSGIKTIKLIVEDQLGCKDSLTKSVTVFNLPQVDISGLEICEEQIINLSTSTSGISSVNWDFGDGNSSSLYNVNKKYQNEGQYIIDLSVVDINGCSNSDTAKMVINPLPTTNLLPLDFCQGEEINLKDLLQSSTTTNSYAWFVENNILNDLDAKYTFNSAGSSPVYISETTPFGCTKYDTTTIFVNQIPSIDFIGDTLTGCDPMTINFTGQTPSSLNAITNWQWTINNKNAGNLNTLNTIFENPGLFDVGLSITDTNDCIATETKVDYINITASPTANFYFSKSPINEVENSTYLNNNSINAIQYDWSYGNGETSNLTEFELTFDSVGVYPIKLIATNNLGCKDSLVKNLPLVPKFTFYFPGGFTPNNDGRNDYFFSSGQNYENIEIWIYDRWGVIAYHKSGQSFSWDGTYKDNGRDCQQDVYVYKAIIKDWNSKEHSFTGIITLLR